MSIDKTMSGNEVQLAIDWISRNREQYAGKWVVLRDGELLASGDSAVDVYRPFQKQEPLPLLIRVQFDERSFAGTIAKE